MLEKIYEKRNREWVLHASRAASSVSIAARSGRPAVGATLARAPLSGALDLRRPPARCARPGQASSSQPGPETGRPRPASAGA